MRASPMPASACLLVPPWCCGGKGDAALVKEIRNCLLFPFLSLSPVCELHCSPKRSWEGVRAGFLPPLGRQGCLPEFVLVCRCPGVHPVGQGRPLHVLPLSLWGGNPGNGELVELRVAHQLLVWEPCASFLPPNNFFVAQSLMSMFVVVFINLVGGVGGGGGLGHPLHPPPLSPLSPPPKQELTFLGPGRSAYPIYTRAPRVSPRTSSSCGVGSSCAEP